MLVYDKSAKDTSANDTSANANSAKVSTVLMRRECECQMCECQQYKATLRCEKSATAVRITTVRKGHCVVTCMHCFTDKSPSSGIVKATFLSPNLFPSLSMDRFEHTHIYTTYQPYFYGRYVDDIGTFVNNVEEAELMLTDLNSKHPTVNSIRTRDTKWGQVLTHSWPHDKSQQRGPSWAETLLQASIQRNHTQLFFPSTLDYKKSNGECGTTSSWNLSDLRIRSNCGEPHQIKAPEQRLPGYLDQSCTSTAEQKDPSRQRITFHPEDSLPVRRLQLQDTGNLRTEQHSRSLGQPKRKNAAWPD